MELRDVIRAPKSDISIGPWHNGSKMSKREFRLSRSGSYRLGPAWAWAIVRFSALGRSFRLLVAYHMGKEEYRAWLGLEVSGDLVLLARYEFHGSHPGWHCHATCADPDTVTPGIVRGFGDRRWPSRAAFHRRTEFGIADFNALGTALKFFGVPARPAEGLFR